MREFIGFLGVAIENKLTLHPSIRQDLGYLWNEYCSDESRINFATEEDDSTEWVGEKYILWPSSGYFNPRLTTWLYNNDQGEIILEVAPSYRWHFQDPKPGERYYTYAEFIKNYQPVLFRIIPKEIAKGWINQAQGLLQEVEARTCQI